MSLGEAGFVPGTKPGSSQLGQPDRTEIASDSRALQSRLPFPDPKLPPTGLPPEMGKKWPKNGFWPHRENGKIGPKMGQKWQFSLFGHFFPIFPGEAKIHFSAIFFPCRGRRPDLGSVEGNRDRNLSANFFVWGILKVKIENFKRY